MKTFWINFLHFYLPPTSSQEVVKEAVKKSYQWIIEQAYKYPNWKFTFNISASLTELLKKYKNTKILSDLNQLVEKEQLEIVDTLAYHPIAPLIPEYLVLEQIKINQEINSQVFNNYKPQGFFLPEMAYAPALGKLLAGLGYQWLVLDEISAGQSVEWNKQYVLKNSDMKIVYRSRDWSQDYPPKKIANTPSLPPYIITATDAELYGHRFVDWEGWLGKVLKNKNIETISFSQYLKTLKEKKSTNPKPSNWEASALELKKYNPFNLWQNKKNKIHTKLWHLARLAIKHVKNQPSDPNHKWANQHLNHGLASCTFWWASGHDFHLFGAPAWHPEEVEKGAEQLVKAVRSLAIPTANKLQAEKLYLGIKKILWNKHWKEYDK